MKLRKLESGEKIEVGDILRHDSVYGAKLFEFVRVTDKFAMVKENGDSPSKFPRVLSEVGLRPSGKRYLWDTVTYSAWRKEQ